MTDQAGPRRFGRADPRSDTELLAATRADPDCFGVFYRRHAADLLAYLWARVYDVDVAGELCAETFALALEGVARFDPERGEPAGWLYGIARHQLSRFWRRRRVSQRARQRLQITTPPVDGDTAEQLERVVDRLVAESVGEALERLPERHATPVRLRVVDQLGYAEIASILGCSEGAARVRVFRALRRLASELDDG